MINREVKFEEMLNSLIDRGGYSRNRQAIVGSVGITGAALSQYSRGHTRPSFQKLVALADFFGVSLDYLVYGETTDSPVDHGPLARYVEHALVDVQSRVARHSELVARIGRLVSDRINDLALELVDSKASGQAGLIQLDEVLRVERYCRQAHIVATDLGSNIIDMSEGEAAAGQFFQVVAVNLNRGCEYQFLLAGQLTINSDAVARFREMITGAVGGDLVNENCSFRQSVLPIMSGSGLYELDVATFAKEEPGLFAQFNKYLTNDNWFGYMNRTNDESNADLLMSPEYTERARSAFEALWSSARTRV